VEIIKGWDQAYPLPPPPKKTGVRGIPIVMSFIFIKVKIRIFFKNIFAFTEKEAPHACAVLMRRNPAILTRKEVHSSCEANEQNT
jgi:hypothetical protein